jgi:glycosyltransferase involved in cell wall biosynthesis
MRRDNTARNWSRKKQIYRDSSIFVAAPSRWLLARAEASILSEAIVDTRLIPNGVDLSTFHPGDKGAARAALGLPQDDGVLLFSGFSPVSSSFKDFASVKEAARILGTRNDLPSMTLVVLGEQRPARTLGSLTLRFVPIETDQRRIAMFHQAADIYVHAAKVGAENHSLTVIEALACGTPVVATAVGGVPEQVLDLSLSSGDRGSGTPTGILTAPNDPAALADAAALLLSDRPLARMLSANAEQDARQRFDLERQVGVYLDWYREIIADRGPAESVALPDRGPSSK